MILAVRRMPHFSIGRLSVDRLLARFLLITATSAGSVLLGWVPNLQTTHLAELDKLDFSTAAYAQTVSPPEIEQYARAVLAIEPLRQSTYNTIKNTIGYVPEIKCDQPSSLSSLDPNIRQYAIDFCNKAIEIADSNNLNITRFNQITVAHESNPTLAEQIRQAISALQGRGGQ